MSKKVRLSVSGRGTHTDAPMVADFLAQVGDYFEQLLQVEETLAEDGESAIEWRVTGAGKSSPPYLEAEAFPRQFAVNVDRRTELVINHAAAGLQNLRQTPARPVGFNDQALAAALRIFERVTNGLDQTRIAHDGGMPVIELTTSSARSSASNVREILRPKGRPYKELGSVEGYVRRIERDGWGRSILWIRHRLTGDEIKCIVTGDAEHEVGIREIGEVWKNRRLQASGTIHYKAAGRIAQIEATEVRFLRERKELPDLDDIADTSFTGGLKSEDYLTRLRDGE